MGRGKWVFTDGNSAEDGFWDISESVDVVCKTGFRGTVRLGGWGYMYGSIQDI